MRQFDFESANEYLNQFYRSKLVEELKDLLYQKRKLARITSMLDKKIDEEIDTICNKLSEIRKEEKR